MILPLEIVVYTSLNYPQCEKMHSNIIRCWKAKNVQDFEDFSKDQWTIYKQGTHGQLPQNIKTALDHTGNIKHY